MAEKLMDKVTAENVNSEYARAQASYYIDDKRKARERAVKEQYKNSGSSYQEKKVLEDDEIKSWDNLKKQLESGQMADNAVMSFANNRIRQKNEKIEKSNRLSSDATEVRKEINQRIANGEDVGDVNLALAQGMVNKGHSYTQIGPNGIITSDKNYYDAWKKLIAQNGQLDGKNFNFNSDTVKQKFKEYGNNYFVMFTGYPEVKQQLVCDGIMTELPPFSMSTEWANSPAGSVGEELDKLLNNEFLEFLGQKTATSQYAVMRRKDQLTARSYKDTGDISFSIKFRCYPGQLVGSKPMTSAKEWLLTLAMTTPINSACSFSVNNAIGTLARAADGAAKAFEDLKDAIKGERTNSDGSKTQVNAEAAVTGMNQVFGSQNAISLDKYNQENVRLSNPKVFGANLFGLRIYPWLFKEPLIVYVSSWNVVPSKEWNESVNDHYFYDFTLNCTMDQKPAAQTWQLKLFNKQLDDHLFYA